MQSSLSGLERAKSERSLLCLLQACQDYRTVVELRNESTCLGYIKNCDGYMNLIMEDVTMTRICGKKETFSQLHVLGKNIRYVHIPDEIDIISAISSELLKMGRTRVPESRHASRRHSRRGNKR